MIKLTKRERTLALATGTFLVGWILYSLILEPTRDDIHKFLRVIPQKQQTLRELKLHAREYRLLCQKTEQVKQKLTSSNNSSLLQFLEDSISQCGLIPNRQSINQQTFPLNSEWLETVVSVEMEKLTLPELVKFLTGIRSTDTTAYLKSINIEKGNSPDSLLNATIQIASLQPNTAI